MLRLHSHSFKMMRRFRATPIHISFARDSNELQSTFLFSIHYASRLFDALQSPQLLRFTFLLARRGIDTGSNPHSFFDSLRLREPVDAAKQVGISVAPLHSTFLS